MGLIKSSIVADNYQMVAVRPRAAILLAIIPFFLTVSCRTVSEEEYLAEQTRADELAEQLLVAQTRLAESLRSERETEAELATLQAQLDAATEQNEASAAELEDALAGIAELTDAQNDNVATIVRMSEQIDSLEQALADMTTETTEEQPTRSPETALTEALSGGAGFQRVSSIGFTADPQAARRVSAPGVAIDTSTGSELLYDVRLDYTSTMAYLTVEDPAGRSPVLRLTAQYATSNEPLWAQTAFIAIEGLDPVDPVDPIVMNVTPQRQTDGTNLIERFSVQVDRPMVTRLSSMLSSQKFTVTFVGPTAQRTHRPSVAERAAMSNILFAFIDLGGLR